MSRVLQIRMSEALYDRLCDWADELSVAPSVLARGELDRAVQGWRDQVAAEAAKFEASLREEPPVVVEPRPVNDALVAEAEKREAETGRHLHRFVKVEGSEHPGRLLGTVEAVYECSCGKSKMELVKK